jgi:phosphate transport system permease protein
MATDVMIVREPECLRPVGQFLGTYFGWLPMFAGTIPASGTGRLAAGLILTIMILPARDRSALRH